MPSLTPAPAGRAPRRALLLAAAGAALVTLGLGLGGPTPARAQEIEAAHPTSASAPAGDGRISLAALKQSGGDLGTTWGQRLQSLLGMAAILGICYGLSNDRARVSWRVVGWGLGLQLGLGFLVLSTGPGRAFFAFANDKITALIGYTDAGAGMVFGSLANPGAPAGFVFAFKVLPSIIFFSCLMAVLYHLGVMQLLVKGIAWVMLRTMKTSGSETLSASGNIFVGQTEAPLLVRPFLKGMTDSELMAIMTGGFATVAGGVMAAYVSMLQGTFADIAGHLLAASVMSAPAALVCAKLMVPEPDPAKSETYGQLKVDLAQVDKNVVDAATRGASDGLMLALNVGAMLLAFTALVALLNGLVGWTGGLFGAPDLTLELILGKLLAPLAWLMGTPWEDATAVGSLIGIKTVLNEFVAYDVLSKQLAAQTLQSPRSVIIATYALCGFSNFASIGIQIGGISAICPERRHDLARIGLRAMLAGSLACFLTATVAGLLC